MFVVALLVLLVADVLMLRMYPGSYYVDIGTYRDGFFLADAHKIEAAPDGHTYRWTRENSTLHLTQFAVGPHLLLTLDLGGRPDPGQLTLKLNGQPWTELTAQTEERLYHLLLPPDVSGDLIVEMQSEMFNPDGDQRRLGVKFEGFGLTVPTLMAPLPTLPHFVSQAVLLLALQLTAIRLGWGWRRQALVVISVALVVAAVLGTMLLLAYVYTARLAVAACILAALTWVLLPIAERKLTWMGGPREVRLLWALMLLCIWIRFVGVFYPTFGAQDLGRNLNRLAMTIRGDLVIIAWSGEFADGDTIYPPGPYLAVMPGLTATGDQSAVLQGSLALLDGTTAFFVAMLVWRLAQQRQAARMAMLLYTSYLAVFGAMTYGFSAQIFGQWLTAPLALILLTPGALARPRMWALALILLLIAVLSHIGVAILAISWVGLILVLRFLTGWRDRSFWLTASMFVGAIALAFGLLYIHIFETTVSHMGHVTTTHAQSGFMLKGNTPLLWKGMRLAYSIPGLILTPLGVFLILRAWPAVEHLVVPMAWVLTTLLFFLVDIATALQVRYFYFSLPLAAAAMAVVLGHLAGRGRVGQPVSWALVLAVAIPNILLWYSATMANGKISMTPLTH